MASKTNRTEFLAAMNIAIVRHATTISRDLWSFGLDLVSAAEDVLKIAPIGASADDEVCEIPTLNIKFDVYATREAGHVVEIK